MSEAIHKTHKKRRSSILIIWLVPFIALLITGWMTFKHFDNKGVDITISFESADGITEGKTPIKYKGIQVGMVSKININQKDLNEFFITATINKRASKAIAREGNIFWKVSPKITLTEISGLDTIVSGSYIEVVPSSSSIDELLSHPKKYNFMGKTSRPVESYTNRLIVTLHATKGDVSVGSPILYKSFLVGKVINKQLEEKYITYTLLIEEAYKDLIKEDSKFWNVSNLEIKASLAGIKVQMGSLYSILTGGITFTSPKDSPVISGYNKSYFLYDKKEHINLDTHKIILEAKGGFNIEPDLSGVYYHGVLAGYIKSLEFNPLSNKSTFEIYLKHAYHDLLKKDPYFKIVQPSIGLDGVKGLDAISKGPYISFVVGDKSVKIKDKYTLHQKEAAKFGYEIILKSSQATGLSEGSNIYYKDTQIGIIRKMSLQQSTDEVVLYALIEQEYANLVNSSSLFYIQSPIEVEANLKHLLVKTAPIKSILLGGIALITPDMKASKGTKHFALYADFKRMNEAKYLQDGGAIYTLHMEKLGSISKHTPIHYKRLKAGEVVDYSYNKNSDMIDVRFYINKEFNTLINNTTHFYNTSGIEVNLSSSGLNIKSEALEDIIYGGISFITLDKNASQERADNFTLFDSYEDASENFIAITLHMKEANELRVGAAIIYKEISIGKVSTLKLDKERNVIAQIYIDKNYAYLINDTTRFWVERFEMSLKGVQNSQAALFGPSIAILSHPSQGKKRDFILSKKPLHTYNKKGLRVMLKADRLSSLSVSSPLYYRQYQIGSIEKIAMSESGKEIMITLFIDEQYAHFVRKNSIFYNATAFGMDVSLFGVKVKTETVETMLNGGIAMVVPTKAKSLAKNNDTFILKLNPNSDWAEYKPDLSIIPKETTTN